MGRTEVRGLLSPYGPLSRIPVVDDQSSSAKALPTAAVGCLGELRRMKRRRT